MTLTRNLLASAALAAVLAGCTAASTYSSSGYDPYESAGYGYAPSYYYAYPEPSYGVSFSYRNDGGNWRRDSWRNDSWHRDHWQGGAGNQWSRWRR